MALSLRSVNLSLLVSVLLPAIGCAAHANAFAVAPLGNPGEPEVVVFAEFPEDNAFGRAYSIALNACYASSPCPRRRERSEE